MKVVGHETISQSFTNGVQFITNLVKKMIVIGSYKENGLTVIATIVHMVNFVFNKTHGAFS